MQHTRQRPAMDRPQNRTHSLSRKKMKETKLAECFGNVCLQAVFNDALLKLHCAHVSRTSASALPSKYAEHLQIVQINRCRLA